MASRATLALLPRRGPAGAATPFLQSRSFSSSLVLLAADQKKPVRHNPLVGNYTPAAPSPAARPAADKPAVSTEHPNATTTPSPDRSPVSSAEVAPNTDLPPRPPPETAAAAAAPSSTTKSPTRFPYDASRASNPQSAETTSATPSKRTTSLEFLSLLNSRKSIHSPLASLDPLARPKVRSAAVTGRTVFIKGYTGDNAATSPPQAIAMLSRLVKKQGVKAKFNYQRFHERRGMKKKRLRMKRWRMQFKKGFRETVRRVMELKRQGW